jgi:hypothetical protein
MQTNLLHNIYGRRPETKFNRNQVKVFDKSYAHVKNFY